MHNNHWDGNLLNFRKFDIGQHLIQIKIQFWIWIIWYMVYDIHPKPYIWSRVLDFLYYSTVWILKFILILTNSAQLSNNLFILNRNCHKLAPNDYYKANIERSMMKFVSNNLWARFCWERQVGLKVPPASLP